MSELTKFRVAKDEYFATEQSPLTPEQRSSFEGLSYYDEHPGLALHLAVEPFDDQTEVEMQTSTGEFAPYVRWGAISFRAEDTPVQLTLYRDRGGRFFLPFQDANAGTETYGAGRYLDIDVDDDGRVWVDFNYAYNPYCAYNSHWSCPLPPAENRLGVAIRAGEKSFASAV
jgi:uncharacterized protein